MERRVSSGRCQPRSNRVNACLRAPFSLCIQIGCHEVSRVWFQTTTEGQAPGRRSPCNQEMIRRDHARGPGVAGAERIPGGRKVTSPSNQDL
jgi:hypothetical protein